MMSRLKEWLSRTNLAGALGLGIVIWLCSLIPVGLIILPLFGARVAAIVASVLLAGFVAFCWGFYASRTGGDRT